MAIKMISKRIKKIRTRMKNYLKERRKWRVRKDLRKTSWNSRNK